MMNVDSVDLFDKKDEKFFIKLKQALCDYLRKEESKSVNGDSLAIKVLKAVLENGYFSSIYSFNYTDLNSIAKKAGINIDFNYEAVHGAVSRNSIILGIDDKTDVAKGYSFLRKVFSEHYTSHSIRYDLQECDEVIFFGHSLGDNDYPYFSDFFESQSRCISPGDSKYITIFTKDNNSRIQILEQLREMNSSRTERLINDNHFMIIMTDNPDNDRLNMFFKHLKDSSSSAHLEMLNNISSSFSL